MTCNDDDGYRCITTLSLSFICAAVYVHTCAYICLHVYMRRFIYIYIRMYVRMYVCIYIYRERDMHAVLALTAGKAVLQKIRDSMRQQYPLVRDVFRCGFG